MCICMHVYVYMYVYIYIYIYIYICIYICADRRVPVSVKQKKTLLSGEPSPCDFSAETATQPQSWCSESLSS